MIDWIIDNKEWLFSGLGVLLITLFWGGIMRCFSKKKNKVKRVINLNGDKSTYVENNKGKIHIK